MISLMLLAFVAAGPTNNASAGAANADNQKIICKSERVVGSNMAQRTCKTREKWAEDRENARDGVRDAQERENARETRCMNGGALIGGNCGSGGN